ncbi:quinon protein alcohol dehydrogenase-like superfamily [Dichotomocladium elegans]|nr:quinon protein alcohol dehydrogenase-like superfamily [Dichotomocladium elegans]
MLQAYPPVPNWYTSHCAKVAGTSYYVYGSRNIIVVLDMQSRTFQKAFLGASDKIQAIAIHDHFLYVATVSEIYAWNLIDKSLLMTYDRVHKSEITVLACVQQGMVLISADKTGGIVVQGAFDGRTRFHQKVSSEVRTVAPVHYSGDDYVAVGYANGMIYVEKVKEDLSLETVYQMIHPDDGVHALAWQKLKSSSGGEWPLLASSASRIRSVIVWNVPQESKYAVLNIPPPSSKWTEQQRTNLRLELAWSGIHPQRLWCTSYIGAVMSFEIKQKSPNYDIRLPEEHGRVIFNLSLMDEGRFAITYALDKKIVLWDLRKRQAISVMATQAAFPYSIDIPRWNPSQAVIGMGDSSIKIWNFSSTMGKSDHSFYQSRLLWQNLQGQIGHAKWNPTREGSVAYSTEYGRLGVYDVDSNKNHRFKFYHQNRGAVHITWAGDLYLGEGTVVRDSLISCGTDGEIYAFHSQKPNEAPVPMIGILAQINPSWSAATQANSDHRFFAIGSTDGMVEIYRLDTFKIIYICNALTAEITAMSWGGPDQSILAVGYSTGAVTMHKISIAINTTEVPVPDTTGFIRCNSHKKAIHDLAWGHHTDKALLASASHDENVLVREVKTNQSILHMNYVGQFKEHLGPVLSVCWSYEDPDVLFSGAEDRFIYLWKYSEHPYSSNNKRTRRTIELENIARKTTSILTQMPSQQQEKASPVDSNAGAISQVKRSAETTDGARKKRKLPQTLLTATKRAQNVTKQQVTAARCLVLAAQIYGGDPNEAIEYVKSDNGNLDMFFGDKNDMRKLLGLEAEQVVLQKDRHFSVPGSETYDVKFALDIMRSAPQESLSTSDVIDWVALALSPTAGKETWLAMMENTAKQLAKMRQVVLAATCYLACSKVYEAIDRIQSHALYMLNGPKL